MHAAPRPQAAALVLLDTDNALAGVRAAAAGES